MATQNLHSIPATGHDDQRQRVAQTVMIATASRRELEAMCSRLAIPFVRQPTATLRQALRQHLLTNK